MRADTVQARRRPGRRARERGAALVMVLLSLVVLTVFLTEVQSESSTAFAGAVTARERLKAEYAARSAVNLTRLLIAMEPTVRASVQPMYMMMMAATGGKSTEMPQIPIWEFIDQVLSPYNCEERHEEFTALAGVDTSTGENLGLGEGTCFDVVVVDEDARINVNVAARGDIISKGAIAAQLLGLMSGPQYDTLFDGEDADGQQSDRATICGAIIDWADFDEDLELCDLSGQATQSGVEDNFYQALGLGYFRKNAAYDSLEELRLVRGMGDDFWATFVDPDPSDPKKRIITVWGQGKINVNTANAQTLYALVCANAAEAAMCPGSPNFDIAQAAAFLQVVQMARAFTMGAPVFASPTDFINTMKGKGMVGPMLASLGVQPVTFISDALVKDATSTRSKMFSVYAEGVVTGRHREARVSIHSVIDFRGANDISKGALGALPGAAGASGSQTGQTGSGSGASPDPAADPLTQMLADLASNPAGQVVYWRMQ